jgi:hypothetical protein
MHRTLLKEIEIVEKRKKGLERHISLRKIKIEVVAVKHASFWTNVQNHYQERQRREIGLVTEDSGEYTSDSFSAESSIELSF